MSLKKMMSILCMLAISVLVFAACENTEEPDPGSGSGTITVAAVDSIAAGQSGEKSIYIRWSASKSKDSTWFTGYELTVSGPLMSAPKLFELDKNQTYYDVTGLTDDQTFTFTIVAVGKKGDSTYKSKTKDIKWALATHFIHNENDANINIYCKESVNYGSGLELYGDNDAPKTHKVAGGASWNIGVGSKSELTIGSASKLGYSVTPTNDAQITAPIAYDTDVLNDLLLYDDLSKMNYSSQVINLTTNSVATGAAKGIVFFAKVNGKDNKTHYAKIVVLKKGGGYLQAGSSDDPYVQVLVSYQTKPDSPYAKSSN